MTDIVLFFFGGGGGPVSVWKLHVHLLLCWLLKVERDFSSYPASGVPCLQNLTAANSHTKDQEGDLSKLSKDAEHGKPRAPSDAQSNIFVLRKMVEEVFTVLYSE